MLCEEGLEFVCAFVAMLGRLQGCGEKMHDGATRAFCAFGCDDDGAVWQKH